MKKIFLFVLTFLFSLNFIFAYVNLSVCGTINGAFLGAETEVRLNANLAHTDTCLSISSSNFVINCDGFELNKLDGGFQPMGISLGYNNNITIKNCKFNGHSSFGVNGPGNLNLNISNNFFNDSGISIIQGYDLIINNNSGLLGTESISSSLGGFSRNVISNNINMLFSTQSSSVSVENNSFIGNQFNTFSISENSITAKNNSFINNNISNLYFGGNVEDSFLNLNYISKIVLINYGGPNYPVNNIFNSNIFANFSNVTSINWSNTPNNFSGNSFLANTVPVPPCFDSPANLICDNTYIGYGGSSPSVPSDSSSIASLPSFGIWSSVVSFILLVSFLLF